MAALGAKVVILDLERAKPADTASMLGTGHLGHRYGISREALASRIKGWLS
jgi:hypothetical protein